MGSVLIIRDQKNIQIYLFELNWLQKTEISKKLCIQGLFNLNFKYFGKVKLYISSNTLFGY